MISREEALEVFKKYNKSERLLHHAFCVEATMREFAVKKGEDPEYWGIVGLLHDIDWEKYPEIHCKKAPELLKEIGADEDFIHAVCSHGWSICTDVEPVKKMEKVLFTIDELTGLVTATALMRPEKMKGITVKSVKKKWSSKGFAAGVNREIIEKGASLLGEEIPFIIDTTIKGMTNVAKEIGLWPEEAV